jgi:hypothetical protein
MVCLSLPKRSNDGFAKVHPLRRAPQFSRALHPELFTKPSRKKF